MSTETFYTEFVIDGVKTGVSPVEATERGVITPEYNAGSSGDVL